MREKNTETNCISEEKIAIKIVAGHQLCAVFKDIQCKFFPVGQRQYAHSNFFFFFLNQGSITSVLLAGGFRHTH